MTGLALITAMCALWICAWCVQTDNYGLAFINALSCVGSAYCAYLFWRRDRRRAMGTCRDCFGSGYGGHPDSGAICFTCGGGGSDDASSASDPIFVKCSYCDGSAEPFDGVPCPQCDATGREEVEGEPITLEDLDLQIPEL